MADRILTLRDLNRATLQRQGLLERTDATIPATIEHLGGLQAQYAPAPYVGLWTRLNNFQRDDLNALIHDHSIVKVTFIRGTLHLMTATDYLLFRATIQPVLSQGYESILKEHALSDDLVEILEIARAYIGEQPRTFAEITAMFNERLPDKNESAMRYGVRMHLPLVQVPTQTEWGYPGNPQFTLAETWLNAPIPAETHLPQLIRRYLAAFGPATIADIATWSGLAKPVLTAALNDMKTDLQTYRDEKKRELFDLAELTLPDADIPAPERFLPAFDNVLLSHDKRTRILADEHRKQVYLPGLRVASTILVDGFVGGVWTTETKKGAATLTITPFAPLPKSTQKALTDEAEKLVRFVASDAKTYAVHFVE